MTSHILSQGAEALILQEGDRIIKNRISKSYRLPELDKKIRKQRTKAEKKLLEKACKLIPAPNPFPLKEFDKLEMPFIRGKKLSEHLDSFSLAKQKQICEQIGKSIAKLHDNDIIHSDLTTSNMILVYDNMSASQNGLTANKENLINHNQLDRSSTLTDSKRSALTKSGTEQLISEPLVYFIDFGLGFISRKPEDKAVDIHLLKQALEAKHFKNCKTLFDEFIKGYNNSKEAIKVLERLKAVEKRGRYKH